MSILLTSSLLLLLLWPACYALLRYSERYTLNRFLLVAAMVAVCALPFVSLESPAPVISESLQGTIAYVEQTVLPLPALPVNTGTADLMVEESTVASAVEPVAETSGLPGVGAIYLLGLGLALLLLTVRLLFILALHLRSRPSNGSGYRLLHPTASSGQAFTFGPNIYFSEDVAGGNDFGHALAHEQVHARQAHSVDIVLSELFLCVFWFHPAAWWLRTRLRANLEYLVDRSVLKGGVDKRNYQLALVRQSQGMRGLALALPFSEPSLKGRIQRMTGLPKYRFIGILAAVVLTSWMGLAGLLVNGSTDDAKLQTLVPGNVMVPEMSEVINDNTQADVGGLKSFELYFRRLPTPYEFVQIQQMLEVLDHTRFSLYHPCEAEEGEYSLQLSHWLNVEAQMSFYLREEELMDDHQFFKLKPNGIGGSIPLVPHVSAGYFNPVFGETVLDKRDVTISYTVDGEPIELEEWLGTLPEKSVTGDKIHLSDYRDDIVNEEIAVFINGERRMLKSRPTVSVHGASIEADKINALINDRPVPTWSSTHFANWREVEAENGAPLLPANARMDCLLENASKDSSITRNVRYGYSGSSRAWFERMKLPEGRELIYYLNDDVSTAAEVLDRDFEFVDMQVGYNCIDPDGPIIVQAVDDLHWFVTRIE